MALDPKKFAKYTGPAILGVFLLAALIILLGIVFPPKSGKSPDQLPNQNAQPGVDTQQLQINSLLEQQASTAGNLKKLYENQVKLNATIADLIKTSDAQKQVQKDNRAYIAMLYNKVLDLELQVQSLGGGYNVKPKHKEDPINPLVGTDSLPAPQPLPN